MKTWKLLAAGVAALTVAGCLAPSPEPSGRKLFNDNCAVCHGRSARGDGPVAEGLDIAPPDLTQIAARNGGNFPMAEVMSTIDGYSRGQDYDTYMPEFGTLLDSATVLFDSGDGVLTPTPAALVALATYLDGIQS